jgi:signaling intermediate in Toll pathway protein
MSRQIMIYISDVGNLRIPFFEDSTENQAVVRRPSVHEQDDGTIFAMCATGTSSRDSLLSWIRSLEINNNPVLAKVPVLFTSKSPLGAVIPIDECDSAESTEHTNLKSGTEHKDDT